MTRSVRRAAHRRAALCPAARSATLAAALLAVLPAPFPAAGAAPPPAPPTAAPRPAAAPPAAPSVAGAAATSVQQLAQRVRPSVVEIIGTVEGSGDTSYGTGFPVRESSLVVTNAHVLRGVKDPMVRTWDGALLASVEVLHEDDAIDLAVLRVTGLRAAPLPLSTGGIPAVGTPVVAVGHPRGYEFTVSDGIVSAVRSLEPGGPELIQTTAPISPGSSGGPLLALDGTVVGVCSLTLTEGQNINFAIPVANIAPIMAIALDVEKGLGRTDPGRMPPDALARLVRSQREGGDLVRAAELAERALGVHPKSLPLLLEAAEVAWSKGNYTAVAGYVDRMKAIAPAYAPGRQVRAALYAQNGQCEGAIPEAQAALAGELAPEQAAEAHAVLGECLGRAGRIGEALAHIDAALASPKVAAVPDYHALRAFLLQARGDADAADREAVTALELSGWDPLVVAALRERGLPRLVEIESKRYAREGENGVLRGVVRNRGPVPLGEITLTAELKDKDGRVVSTGTGKASPARLVPGQTGSFRIVLEAAPEGLSDVALRVVDIKEN